MPAASMTGFARAEGATSASSWAWELRSVNGRGLDLRFRLPPGFDGLEASLRDAAGRVLKRGNVTASLTLRREETRRLSVDAAALEQAMAFALDLCARIPGCPPPRAEALLALPGVLRPEGAEADA
ncbi:MAG TPA: YicC/YloC family endoribonuclease, partial [Acetobacteraceae bacterium]|nr:YicC/YloC family endoribonuclease [Acetobacteraceae bacterium]